MRVLLMPSDMTVGDAHLLQRRGAAGVPPWPSFNAFGA